MRILNLTQHTIVVPLQNGDLKTFLPAGEPAGVEQRGYQTGTQIDDIPIRVAHELVTMHLPDPQPEVCLIVTALVAYAALASGRSVTDLLIPADVSSKAHGSILQCRALATLDSVKVLTSPPASLGAAIAEATPSEARISLRTRAIEALRRDYTIIPSIMLNAVGGDGLTALGMWLSPEQQNRDDAYAVMISLSLEGITLMVSLSGDGISTAHQLPLWATVHALTLGQIVYLVPTEIFLEQRILMEERENG
jgi:hypothetical protein